MLQEEYFKFVKSLAVDLNRKEVSLTSFPDVVMRIRKALDDPDTTCENLAKILSVDPVLAMRTLILANSTFYSPGGIKIQGLGAAVGRVGFEKVRTTAIAYAVEQLHASKDLEPLKDELRQTWSEGLRLAAMSEVIAQQCSTLDEDRAFIAGLLHRIGVLYIFTKYTEYPGLLQDPESRRDLINEWAAPIGESIVANWNFTDDIQATLNPDEVETTHRRSEANLADIVIVAKSSLSGRDDQLFNSKEVLRLQLTEEQMPAIMESYQQKLASLASAVH